MSLFSRSLILRLYCGYLKPKELWTPTNSSGNLSRVPYWHHSLRTLPGRDSLSFLLIHPSRLPKPSWAGLLSSKEDKVFCTFFRARGRPITEATKDSSQTLQVQTSAWCLHDDSWSQGYQPQTSKDTQKLLKQFGVALPHIKQKISKHLRKGKKKRAKSC